MEYRVLGRSGLKISVLTFGTMTFGGETVFAKTGSTDVAGAQRQLDLCLDAGVNIVDTANIYSKGRSEEILGEAMDGRRHRLLVATKARFPMGPGPNDAGLSRHHLIAECEASLRRLRTDHIDLYQLHEWDGLTPLEETMEALHDVVKSGKVRYLGASSMAAWQFAKAQQIAREHGWTRFISMQNHYNLEYREEEREMIPLCRDQGVAVIPWSPLARGFLAGNRDTADTSRSATIRAQTDDVAQKYYGSAGDLRVLAELSRLARQKAVSNATLAYAWLLHKGVTAPIVGATKLPHLEQAVAALYGQLTDEDVALLEAPYEPHRVIGHT